MTKYLLPALTCMALLSCNQSSTSNKGANKTDVETDPIKQEQHTSSPQTAQTNDSDAETYTSKDLIGHWVSMDDKNYTIVISDSTFEEFYEKKKESVESYQIAKDKLTRIDMESGDTLHYDILSTSKNNITFLYENGNILAFKRLK